MSRYDGLIIPRSYSEYINKTDAATLQQALQLSGVLSGTVAAGDNKAIKSAAVNNAIGKITQKVKEVTGVTSANGNLQLGLSGERYIVTAVQTYNSEGFNNDTIAIPYKLGDRKPLGVSDGRWGVHCISSNTGNTVLVNTTMYLTVYYYEK